MPGGGDAPRGQVPRGGFVPKGLDYVVKQEEGEAAGGGVGTGPVEVVARVGC